MEWCDLNFLTKRVFLANFRPLLLHFIPHSTFDASKAKQSKFRPLLLLPELPFWPLLFIIIITQLFNSIFQHCFQPFCYFLAMAQVTFVCLKAKQIFDLINIITIITQLFNYSIIQFNFFNTASTFCYFLVMAQVEKGLLLLLLLLLFT